MNLIWRGTYHAEATFRGNGQVDSLFVEPGGFTQFMLELPGGEDDFEPYELVIGDCVMAVEIPKKTSQGRVACENSGCVTTATHGSAMPIYSAILGMLAMTRRVRRRRRRWNASPSPDRSSGSLETGAGTTCPSTRT